MTKDQIRKLRPEFTFGQMTMVDWFEIVEGGVFCSIRSGLRHADGETKSPFFYEETVVGKNAVKQSIEKFTQWYNLNKQ
jgi:hypothetical protein